MFNDYNKDIEMRDHILFGGFDKNKYRGGIRRFECIPLNTAKELIEKRFLSPDENQNASPTTAEMIEFAESHPEAEVTFSGYAVSDAREDYRITFDTIEVSMASSDDPVKAINDYVNTMSDFIGGIFCNANECDTGRNNDGTFYAYAWWD